MCTLNEALDELETVDNSTKNKVENELVSVGTAANSEPCRQITGC